MSALNAGAAFLPMNQYSQKEDWTGKETYCVKVDTATDKQAALCTGVNNEIVVGVIYSGKAHGSSLYDLNNTAQIVMEAGAAITRGDRLSAGTDGRVIPTAANKTVVGTALEAATAAGDKVWMQVAR